MLLKKQSKQARSGFKRKKLSVAGSYQEIKAKGGQMMASNPQPPKPPTAPTGQRQL